MGVVTGGGGGGAAFNGGTITAPLTIANPASNSDTLTLTSNGTTNEELIRATAPSTTFLLDGDGRMQFQSNDTAEFDIVGTNGTEAFLTIQGATESYFFETDLGWTSTSGNGMPFRKGIRTTALTSGALPTTTFVSGTGKQILTARDVYLVVPCTLNPTAGAAGTVAVALSPDNVTYSTLATLTEPAGVALDGTIMAASLQVPAAWYVKLTATNATIGTGTYY